MYTTLAIYLTLLFKLGGVNNPEGNHLLKIEGIKDIQGNIAIMVFNSEVGFPKDESKAILKKVLPVNKKQMTIPLGNLPSGDYAISVIQDVNINEKLDVNVLGMPKEPFGFSNNASILFGLPGFNRAKITFNEIEKITTIKLIDLY